MRSTRKIALPLLVLGSGLAASVPAWTETDGIQQDRKIVVEQLGGAVEVEVAGVAADLGIGSQLGLPARIVTGSDGNMAIRQSRTGVAIAPDSDVEIPAAARDGQLIARMIQHRGTAFYDVEPRPIEKLRVETPYLVAVVKGTQFSVLVGDGQTTVSLFEGLLELRSIDDTAVVELAAGQIAVGVPGGGIRILPMDADLLPVAAVPGQEASIAGPQAAAAIADVAAASDVDAITLGQAVTAGSERVSLAGVASFSLAGGSGIGAEAGVGIDTGANLGGGSVGVGLDAGLDAGADLGSGSVDLGLDAGLDAGTDLGGGSVSVGLDAGLDAGADLGGGSVDLGLDAGLDVGTDTGSVDVGLDVGLDVGSDSALAVDADLGLGDVEIDAGLETDLDLGVLDVEDTLEDLLDPGDDDTDTEEDDSLLPDLPLPLF